MERVFLTRLYVVLHGLQAEIEDCWLQMLIKIMVTLAERVTVAAIKGEGIAYRPGQGSSRSSREDNGQGRHPRPHKEMRRHIVTTTMKALL